jgi:hypothetical protein
MKKSSLQPFMKVGLLTLLHPYKKEVGKKRIKFETSWYCMCECGGTIVTRGCALTSTYTTSCGCLRKILMKSVRYKSEDHKKYSEEERNSKLFKRWRGIWSRTQTGPSNKNYKIYAGKGISVCNEWRDYYAFKSWALSNGFSENLTIDRIENFKGYEPNNCRWVSMAENLKNRVLKKYSKPPC